MSKLLKRIFVEFATIATKAILKIAQDAVLAKLRNLGKGPGAPKAA